MNLRDVYIEIKAYINVIDHLLENPTDDNISEAKGYIETIKEVIDGYDNEKWLIAKNIEEYNVINNTFLNEINKVDEWVELYEKNKTRVNFTFKDVPMHINNKQRYHLENYPYLADAIVKHMHFYKNELEFNYNEFIKLNSKFCEGLK